MTPPPAPPTPRFQRFLQGYKTVSLLAMNTLILFVVLNILCWIGLKLFHKGEDTGFRPAPDSMLAALYPDLSEAQRGQFQNENHKAHLTFEPFTMYRTEDCSGSYLNVRKGIRNLGETPWPPSKDAFNVFVFGGSTTFGSTPDGQTIPAYLQAALRGVRKDVVVYNLGRVFYYSTQERIYFQQLLQSGIVPQVAVFIDGLNDFYHTGIDVPQPERFQQVFAGKPRWPLIPVVKVWRALSGPERSVTDSLDQSPEALRKVIDRYLANKRLIEASARAFGVTPVFAWQPVPTYQRDLSPYPFDENDLGRHCFTKRGYPMMAEIAGKSDLGDHFLWLADLQKGVSQPIYVDQIHYSPAFSKTIADALAGFLTDRKFVPPASN